MKVPIWNRVTIVGCGLIGVSFALALRRNRLAAHIAGWDTSETALADALSTRILDEVDYSFSIGAMSDADLIYLAMPVNAIVDFLKTQGLSIKAGTLITDAGSTKTTIVHVANEFLPQDSPFIGGHPIAGSHLRGMEHAEADLFSRRPYILIAKEIENPEPCERLSETIARIGARSVLMTAGEHDRAMAFVSHLPQILSSVLDNTIESVADSERLLDVAGSGYTDMTRLALSSWSIWRDILLTNHGEIGFALDEFIGRLQLVRDEMRLLDQNRPTELALARSLFNKRNEQMIGQK